MRPLGLVLATSAAILALQVARASHAQAQAPRTIWSGDDLGVSRDIALVLDGPRVLLAEAGSVTVVDRATGATTSMRLGIDTYFPVTTAIFADGRLWLGGGYHASGTLPLLVAFDPTTGRTTTRARMHDTPASLAWAGGELYWVDRGGRHIHRIGAHGAARVVATAPDGQRFESDPRVALPVDDAFVYAVIGPVAGGPGPHPLVRIPRHGGAREVLDPDVAARVLLLDRSTPGGALVMTYTMGVARSIERFDLTTRARTTIVAEATPVAVHVADGTLAWIDGNFFSGADFALMRVPVSGGTTTLVHRGDRRLGSAIALDAAGVVALVGGHPEGECHTRMELEPGDLTFTTCSAPDHRLLAVP